MRTLIALTILLAQLAIAGEHIGLEAREVASGTMSYDEWSTSWGSYDRSTIGTKAIEIALRNFGHTPATASLTIYFVSDGYECGRAERSFELAGGQAMKSVLAAPATLSRTVKLNAIGYQSTSGTQPVTNWFVIARENGRVVAIKASTHESQAELEKMLRAGTLR